MSQPLPDSPTTTPTRPRLTRAALIGVLGAVLAGAVSVGTVIFLAVRAG